MGKIQTVGNRPTNSSLSYTLEKLRTFVRIRREEKYQKDEWAVFARSDLRTIQLSEKGKQKFLNHFQFLKNEFGIDGFYRIESANNFPADCGLASSASSFAALTLATSKLSSARKEFSCKQLAALSQKGSGSSCRSFFSPWSEWNEGGGEAVELPFQKLRHQVLLCDENIKSVSSSEAHLRVLTSDMFVGRVERATNRLNKLIKALKSSDWKQAYEISWNEFWDMHILFQTAQPSFQYMNAKSFEALTMLHNYWNKFDDGPLITMDAGSNIHLLYRQDQEEHYAKLRDHFKGIMPIWTDEGYIEKCEL